MFKSFEDWWSRAGRWQREGMKKVAAKARPRWEHPVVELLALEMDIQQAAIEAMLDACPDYDGDLSEFGEEPMDRMVRIGIIPVEVANRMRGSWA